MRREEGGRNNITTILVVYLGSWSSNVIDVDVDGDDGGGDGDGDARRWR